MISKLMGKEEVNAALVVAILGALMVLVAKGGGTLSLGGVVDGVLSNPVPKRVSGTREDTHTSDRQIAA